MKPIKYSAILLAVSSVCLLIISCNSGSEKKEPAATEKTDTIVTRKKEPITNSGSLMIIKHKVADFNKWFAAYESHDSIRLAYGLHNYGISRGIDDSNLVMVALKMDDIDQAKKFAAMPELKERMQKGGVIGEPNIMFYNRQSLFLSTNDPSARAMITHKVKDWVTWKNDFDNHKQARKDAGLIDRSVGYEVGNDKMVTVVVVVNDLPKARAFFNSPDLKNKMQAAGVEGPPTIYLYNLIKSF